MKGKTVIWIVAIVLVCIGVGICFAVPHFIGENDGEEAVPAGAVPDDDLIVTDAKRAADGVSVEFDAWDLDGKEAYIDVIWKNEGSEVFGFGRNFDIQYAADGTDRFESCATEDFAVTMELIMLAPGEEMPMRYDVSAFDLTKSGRYRFLVQGDVWVEFER